MNKRFWLRPAVGTALLLSIPLVMTILDRHKLAGEGWDWGPLDFVAMGALLFGAGVAYEFVATKFGARRQRLAWALIILCAVLAIWVELAVGAFSRFFASMAA